MHTRTHARARTHTLSLSLARCHRLDAADCRLMSNLAELAIRELERHVKLKERLHNEQEKDLIEAFK